MSRRKNITPTLTISRNISPPRIKSVRRRGLSSITLFEGGNEARAMAAKVSMIRLIHNICVTVSGDSVPIKAPMRTSKQAVTLTVSWNRRKR